ncbi:N,N'-diacetylbacillosaminyl-diphospho-undecaprenol alpha-1,3-N-acetylgalactosaminyltransferase [Aliarcobacter faecis]|uniref:glycosyltransferase family 4 protein n=1 Tax=Aliarcobacter faecis TaxID=1564138 RepID=UPI00047EAACE|nr:glycosyltransferase family 4 protein [Aliarcobacter faecis]QKF73462.1 N,N'-diacetylbacillosaminyl-diphospho-undecaprenol alpha-1,3-N-acetylgalactosaminyltransferase [Aliarcobacter faecis]
MSKTIGFLSHLDLNLYLFRAPIIKELVSKGHKVYAICPSGDKNDALKSLGCEVVNYKISRKGLNPFAEILTIKKIYEVIKPLDLDILQNFTAKPNIYGSIAGKKANIPLVCNAVTGLGSFYIDGSFKSKVVKTIMNILYKYANSKANKCIFQNSDDMNYFVDSGFVEAKKAVLIKSSGIDTEAFVSQEPLKNEKINVLMVARAIWHKGIKEYYEAAKILENEDIEFIFIGDTDNGNISCASKDFLKNGNVKWLGHRNDIKEQIDKCNIFVLPSFYGEGVPRTLLEAASMGKPIVTTDNVGCREVVDDGVNGFLVPVKDSQVLAKKIKILVENENMRKEFGKASREKALNEFDVKVVVEQYLRLYNV